MCCLNRPGLVPFFGVPSQTYCANRDVLVPVLGGAARNTLRKPCCSGAGVCFGGCGSKCTVQPALFWCLFWGVRLEIYCANRDASVPVLGGAARNILCKPRSSGACFGGASAAPNALCKRARCSQASFWLGTGQTARCLGTGPTSNCKHAGQQASTDQVPAATKPWPRMHNEHNVICGLAQAWRCPATFRLVPWPLW